MKGLAVVGLRWGVGGGTCFHLASYTERVVGFVNVDVGPAKDLSSVDVTDDGDSMR